MDNSYVHSGEITNAVILKWAYDEEMLLLDQDEDLIAAQREYFPALFTALEDPDCPKWDYILSILDFYLMFAILKSGDSALPVVEEAIAYCEKSQDKRVQQWNETLKQRVRYQKGIGPVDEATALIMGHSLLNGICRSCSIRIADETRKEWIVELSVAPSHQHKERIYISKTTGQFSYKELFMGRWI